MAKKFINLTLGCILLGALWVAIDFFMHASHNYGESFLTGAVEWIFLSIVFAFLDRANRKTSLIFAGICGLFLVAIFILLYLIKHQII